MRSLRGCDSDHRGGSAREAATSRHDPVAAGGGVFRNPNIELHQAVPAGGRIDFAKNCRIVFSCFSCQLDYEWWFSRFGHRLMAERPESFVLDRPRPARPTGAAPGGSRSAGGSRSGTIAR